MTDVHSRETRSYNMGRIRAKDTRPELLVRRFLFARGFRYRIHDKKLPGKPDIVLPRYKTVIFVHGCFWHGHEGCRYFVVPKTKTDWWLDKINGNRNTDRLNLPKLEELGWRVLTVFECELKPRSKEKTLNQLLKNIKLGNTGN